MLFAAIKGDGAPVEGGRNPQYLARILEECIHKRFQKTDQKYMDKIHSMISTLEDVRKCKLRNSFLRGRSPLNAWSRLHERKLHLQK